MTLLDDRKSSEDVDAEALIKEARRLRRRRWGYGIAAVTILMAGGIGISVGLTGGGSGGSGIKNTAASASPPHALVAALDNVPTALRQAFIATIEAKSFEFSGLDPFADVQDVPIAFENRSIGLELYYSSKQLACQQSFGGILSTYEDVFIGSRLYSISVLCQSGALSLCTTITRRSGYGSFGLSAWQSAFFSGWVKDLQGSNDFRQTSSGFTWKLGHSTWGGFGPTSTGFNGLPGSAVIQDGRLTAFTVNFLNAPVGKPAQQLARTTTFTHFNSPTSVTLPKTSSVNTSCSS